MWKLLLLVFFCSVVFVVVFVGVGGVWVKLVDMFVKFVVDVKFDLGLVDSFFGVYFVVFMVDSDGDYKNVIDFYCVVFDFELNNLQFQERLMINLFLNGDFEEGVKFVQMLKKDLVVECVIMLFFGIDVICQK